MPLDMGAVTTDLTLTWCADQDPGARAPTLGDGPNIGSALRAIREFRRLDIDYLERLTRIRGQYLIAIEEMRLDQLPSTPFAIGYVRAYADALGQDPDQAVLRFRHDAPVRDEPLRAPLGVTRERDPRLTLVAVCGAIVVSGIVLWNVAQRAMTLAAPPPATIAEQPAAAAPKAPPPAQGLLKLGAAMPAPQESTTPKPYVTPGLESQLSSANDTAASAAGQMTDAQAAALGLETEPPVGSPFTPDGTVYGVPPEQGAVIIQARKAGSVTIHGADGSVYFARLLSKGQAYRAPLIKGLSVEVSEPENFAVYVGGQLKGAMPAPKADVTSLAQ